MVYVQKIPDEVVRIILNDPIVQRCWKESRIENISYEKFLECCVIAMAERNKELIDQEVEMSARYGFPGVVIIQSSKPKENSEEQKS